MKDLIGSLSIGTGTLILALFLLLVGSGPGMADYYRYVDQSGAVRYTDDILEVPKAQRSGAKKITGVQVTFNEDSVDTTTEDAVTEEPDEIPQNDKNQLEYERLTQERKALDEEYDALQKESAELAQDRETLPIKEYNKKVRQLNNRIATYEEKRAEFKKVADAYNVQLKK